MIPSAIRQGEAFYLRDQATGELWSPTALPIRDPEATYVARHGHGLSRFEHTANGVAADLAQFVPLEGSIKISRLKLTNTIGPRPRPRLDRLRRMGVGAIAIRLAGVCRNRNGLGDRRDVGAQSVEYDLRLARRLRRHARRPDRLDGRPARIHRPQRRLGGAGGAADSGRLVENGRRRPRPLRRDAHPG